LLPHVSVQAGNIPREQMSVPSYNSRYGSTFLVYTNVVSIMAAYSGCNEKGLLRVEVRVEK